MKLVDRFLAAVRAGTAYGEPDLRCYDSFCNAFAEQLADWATTQGLSWRELHLTAWDLHNDLHPATLPGTEWGWHEVLEVEGRVRDLWLFDELLLDEYLRRMFPGDRVRIHVEQVSRASERAA